MGGPIARDQNGCPLPTTGHATRQFDDAADARVSAAANAFKTIVLKYRRQQLASSRINILRLSSLGRRGVPLDGRRLGEVSHAGKSKLLTLYRDRMNSEAMPDGAPPNPYRVLYVELKGSKTLKMFCKELLKMLGDPHWNTGNADDVEERLRTFILYRGVELLIVDEVQHLNGDSQNKMDLTDELKLFLDAGIVPVVFAGNEKSKLFFERNEQLCARLGEPLDLSPLRKGDKAEMTMFKEFCRDLDLAIKEKTITRQLCGLDTPYCLNGLIRASGGHVGRIVRIVESAVEHAVGRDADLVEIHDLFHAVEAFAMPMRYLTKNPFGL